MSSVPPRPTFKPKPRRPIEEASNLVAVTPPHPEVPFLAGVGARQAGLRLSTWIAENRETLGALLAKHGAVHFTGFGIGSPDALRELVEAFGEAPVRYDHASTPRTHLESNVYTSTEYPAEQDIPLHNEMSYAAAWPMQIWLCCLRPADEGGRSPFADSRAVLSRIPGEVRARFERHGVLYRRNFNTGLDLTWQETFGCDDPQEVERRLAGSDTRLSWMGAGRLQVDQVRPATVVHPESGETVWFNQAHLFHISALPADIGEHLAALGPDEVPRNAFFGDGTPIPPEDLVAVRAAYDAETRWLPLAAGDLVLADNMLIAHGREAFRGPRRVIVAMSKRREG